MGPPLPRGTTGFGQTGSRLEVRELRAALHAAARTHGFRVEGVGRRRVDSFSAWLLYSTRSESFWVLEHGLVPIVAATDQDPARVFKIWEHIIDSPVVADIAEQSGWRLVTAAEAAEPASGILLSGLAEQELEQVRYWKPSFIAEVAFNHWD